MTYEGGYGFDRFIAQGGAATDEKMAEFITNFLSQGFYSTDGNLEQGDFSCSSLSVTGENEGQIFGRNYDWENCSAMIVHTIPENGYESISTVCLDFLGFGDDWKPEGFANQYMSLAAVYLPLDGMNEKGLCVADLMAGDTEATHQNTNKPDLTTVSAIRLLLDRAATVEEAITLLEEYDMNSSIESAHHLAICDAKGNSVVVEWIDNQMYVTETAAVTNHYLTEGKKYGVGNQESHSRLERLLKMSEVEENPFSLDTMKDAMKEVSYPEITQWSIVYDQKELSLIFYWQRNFDNGIVYEIGQ